MVMTLKKYHLFMANDRDRSGGEDYAGSYDYLADAKAHVAALGAWWADVMIADETTGGLRILEQFHVSDVDETRDGWRVVSEPVAT